MSPETKKTLLIGGAGLAGVAVIWYLLKSSSANVGVSSAGVQPLQVPTPGDITFNYPPLENTGPVPVPTPTCTELCEHCDDSTSYGGAAVWKVAPNALAAQYANLQSIGQQTGARYVSEAVAGLAGVTEMAYEPGFGSAPYGG